MVTRGLVDIEIDVTEVKRRLGKLSNNADKVIARASKRAATTGRKIISQETAKTYNVRVGDSRKSMAVKRNAPFYKIEYRDNYKNLFYFGKDSVVRPRHPVTGGDDPDPEFLSTKILAKQGYKAMKSRPRPFVQITKSGNIAVFQRISNKDRRIRGVAAPPMPEAFTAHPDVQAKFKRDTTEMLEKRLEHEIQRVLEGN